MNNLSILVPHKDSPHRLKRLLESIPDGINIIVVDDNSKENSLKLIKSSNFVSRAFKLVMSDQKPGNAGVARNVALSRCVTEWVIFADADDLFYREGLINLVSYIKRSLADVVFFGVDSLVESNQLKGTRSDVYQAMISDWPKSRDYIAFRWPVPWGKAIKREFLVKNGIWFSSRIASNDVEFSAKIASRRPVISAFKQTVYCCFESDDSLTATLTPAKAYDRVQAGINRNFIFFKCKAPVRLNYNFKFFLNSMPFVFRHLRFSIIWRFPSSVFIALLVNFCLLRRWKLGEQESNK